MKTWLATARQESGLSPEDCASALECSRTTYLSRENKPGKLSLDEVRILQSIFNPEGKKTLWNALVEFKP